MLGSLQPGGEAAAVVGGKAARVGGVPALVRAEWRLACVTEGEMSTFGIPVYSWRGARVRAMSFAEERTL